MLHFAIHDNLKLKIHIIQPGMIFALHEKITYEGKYMQDNFFEKSVKDIVGKNFHLPMIVDKNISIANLIKIFKESGHNRKLYVVDESSKLMGLVQWNHLLKSFFEADTTVFNNPIVKEVPININSMILDDIIDFDAKFVFDSSKVGDILYLMLENDILQLPIISHKHEVIGEINFIEIISEYQKYKIGEKYETA